MVLEGTQYIPNIVKKNYIDDPSNFSPITTMLIRQKEIHNSNYGSVYHVALLSQG